MKVLHNRFHDIGGNLADLGDLHVIPLAGEDSIIAKFNHDALEPTPLWWRIVEKVEKVKPRLLILDPLQDLFAGDQNSPTQAKRFVNMLTCLAMRLNLAILVCAHPSKDGMTRGGGTSGTVAWNNSFRSRMYFETFKEPKMNKDDADEADVNLRTLTLMKSNYGPLGMKINLRWTPGGFEIEDEKEVDPALEATQNEVADLRFLELLKWHESKNVKVSLKEKGANYAPRKFHKIELNRENGFSPKQLEAAMNRLLATDRIANVDYGSKSDDTQMLIVRV